MTVSRLTASSPATAGWRGSRTELVAWGIAAFLVGGFLATLDMPAREYESGLLVFMLAGFWLALPGRAPSALLAIACGLGPLLAHYVTMQLRQPMRAPPAAAMLAVFAGALAGRLAGRRLDVHGDARLDAPLDTSAPWYARPMNVRTLLAVSLSALVAAGLVPVFRVVRAAAKGALHIGLAEVRWWQVATFVGWVLVAPTLLRLRTRLRPRARAAVPSDGLTPLEALAHFVVILCLTGAHAVLVAALTRYVVPTEPDVSRTVFAHLDAIAQAYLPFDALTYAAVLGLAYLADTERQVRDARQRAAALQAAALTARLAAVRARLNPHFLYNALNAAVMLARDGRGAETSHVLEDLTGLLRYVLNQHDDMVPLDAEVDFVQRYLEIQQVRFGARLRYTIDVDADVAHAPVPPLVLQPLVENAVEHGAAAVPEASTVQVSATRAGDTLVLAVVDDGPGVAADTGAVSGTGVGLGHTRERLAGLFGAAASVTLTPLAPHGTRAEVRLPLARVSDPA